MRRLLTQQSVFAQGELVSDWANVQNLCECFNKSVMAASFEKLTRVYQRQPWLQTVSEDHLGHW
jgi:hypothetical protein